MKIANRYADKIAFCSKCYEFEEHPIDGKVCGHTGQPIFLMDICPMADDSGKPNPDPCFWWFNRGSTARLWCKKCQFLVGKTCHTPYGSFPIEQMARCVLPRLNSDGSRRQPKDIYPVLREV